MKRLVFWILILSLLSMTALAAPLEQSNLETQPIDAFARLSEGDIIANSANNDNTWVFYDGGTGVYKNGIIQVDTLDPALPFTVRINLAERYEADTVANFTGVAFYLENNSTEEAGVAFFGESFGGFIAHDNGVEGPAEHQLTYLNGDFYDVTCYLVSLDGTITRVEDEYYGYNNYSLASVPPEFKGWFLIDLENGGFNCCHYGRWGEEHGFHSAEQCDNGRFERGVHGLRAVGFSLCGDLLSGENVLIGDYAFWAPKDGFEMPEEGESIQPTEVPTEAPKPTEAETETPQLTEAPTQAPQTSGSFPVWAWAAIGAAVIVLVCVVLIAVSKKKKS